MIGNSTSARFSSILPAALGAAAVSSIAADGRTATISELKARAAAAATAADAVEASKALRRAGLVTDAITTVGRAFGKARGNDAVADLHLELARGYIEQRQQKK